MEDLEAALRLQPGSRALASERAAAVATYHALPGAAPRPSARRDVHVVPATATAAASAASPAAVASPSAGGGPSAGHGSQASSAPRETASGAADARPSAEGGAPVARSPAPAAAKLPSLAAPRELHSGCEIEEMVEEIPVEEPTPPPAPSSAAARQPGSGAGVGRHAPARAEGAATGDSSSPSPQQTAPSPAQQPPTRARAQAAPPAPGSGPDTAPRGAPVGVHPGSAEAPTGAAPAADVHPPQSTADGAQVPEAAASAAAPGSSGPAQSAPVAPRGSAGPASLEAAAAFAAAQMKLSKPRSGEGPHAFSRDCSGRWHRAWLNCERSQMSCSAQSVKKHISQVHRSPASARARGRPQHEWNPALAVAAFTQSGLPASSLCVNSMCEGESSAVAGVEFERTWRMLLSQPEQQVGWLTDSLQMPRCTRSEAIHEGT